MCVPLCYLGQLRLQDVTAPEPKGCVQSLLAAPFRPDLPVVPKCSAFIEMLSIINPFLKVL